MRYSFVSFQIRNKTLNAVCINFRIQRVKTLIIDIKSTQCTKVFLRYLYYDITMNIPVFVIMVPWELKHVGIFSDIYIYIYIYIYIKNNFVNFVGLGL